MAFNQFCRLAFEFSQPIAQGGGNCVPPIEVLSQIDVFRGNGFGQSFDLIELTTRENFSPVLRVGASQGKLLIQP